MDSRTGVLWLCIPVSIFAQQTDTEKPPLSAGQKLTYHLKRMVEPGVLVRAGVTAAVQQARDAPPEWGQGAGAYGKRYAAGVGSNAVRNALAFGLDAPLHEDPRFYRLGKGSLWKRTGSALLQTVICRNDSGGKTIAVWRVGSAFGASAIAASWRPVREERVSDITIRGTVTLGIDTASNLFREFWPDIKRILQRK